MGKFCRVVMVTGRFAHKWVSKWLTCGFSDFACWTSIFRLETLKIRFDRVVHTLQIKAVDGFYNIFKYDQSSINLCIPSTWHGEREVAESETFSSQNQQFILHQRWHFFPLVIFKYIPHLFQQIFLTLVNRHISIGKLASLLQILANWLLANWHIGKTTGICGDTEAV